MTGARPLSGKGVHVEQGDPLVVQDRARRRRWKRNKPAARYLAAALLLVEISSSVNARGRSG